MRLPSNFAYDTETGQTEDGIRTVLVQVCSTSARSPEETVIFEGVDSVGQFLDSLEETPYDMDVHAYNLKYEWSWLRPWVFLREYQWTDKRKLAPGEWSIIEDSMSVYRVKIRGRNGSLMTITDDMKRVGPYRMEKVSQQVRTEHPDWWPSETTKLSSKWYDEDGNEQDLYNVWYTFAEDDPRRIWFMEYARLDAYSQAMIARWLHDRGYDQRLTMASNGLRMSLDIRYRRNPDEAPWQFARRFRNHYPPLDREMQDIVEHSISGGFVYGETGTWKGPFIHADYSSSYPYEYAFGDMFIGRVTRMSADDPNLKLAYRPCYMRWVLVSFGFELAEHGMPALNCKDARTHDNNYNGQQNKKMRRGRIVRKLFTESYLEELKKHYHISALTIHEVWFAHRKKGDFFPAIKQFYEQKSRPELKDTISRLMWKGFMNGGIHGKSITKTHRRSAIYPDNERKLEETVTEPVYCSLIGFTAMQNARKRLLRECRIVQEHGFHVFMCDTDSMIVNCTAREFIEILGPERFVTEDGGIYNLGKFELETSKDGAVEFEELRCWGLKRYLEIHDGKYRKSAFAGMNDSLQSQLMDWRTDGTEYTWKQNVQHQDEWGKVIQIGKKHARAEDIWYHEPVPAPRIGNRIPLLKLMLERMKNGNRC